MGMQADFITWLLGILLLCSWIHRCICVVSGGFPSSAPLIRKCSILLGESNYCFWLEQAPSAVSFSAFHKFVCSGPGGTLPQTPSYQLQNSLPGALFGKPVLARSSLTFNSEPPRASPPCALADTFPSCRKLGQEHSTAICLSFLRNQCHWLPCVQSPRSLCCMYFSPNSRILNQTLLL